MTGPPATAEWTEERFSDEWVKAWHVFKRRGYADYEAGRCAALHARSQEQFRASGGSGELHARVAELEGSGEAPAGLEEAAQEFLDAYVESERTIAANDIERLDEAEINLRTALRGPVGGEG